ncbi:MAG: glycosyltransferase family 2 protein [Verrucomicrobia bacterium]|nr:glycosyltransferase family 2 protein [Verrucomicrobiota bacterium]
MKTTLFIPTLNEIKGMQAIMPRIKREWVDQILIMDGASSDGTAEWAREQGYEVHVQQEKGLRQAFQEAWPLIKGDIVITFSPDGNSIPELIPPLIAKIKEGYDMVIVSRYLPPARSADDSWLTAFGNWMFTFLINLLHRGHLTDAMVMFRAYKTDVPDQLDIFKEESHRTPERLFHTRVGIEPLLSVRALKRKLKVGEIPGDEPPRIGGKAKLQIWRWGAAYLFQVIREVFWWR